MDVMKVGWRDGRPETDSLFRPRLSIYLVTSDDDRLLRVFSEAFKAAGSV